MQVDKTADCADPIPSRDIGELLRIMARLRDPSGGCPWDLQQTFRTIAPYTIEEAFEVADAIEREALGDLCDELGDLLLQVVFHAQMASELGAFEFGDVVMAITSKMIRRHPHVFGDAAAREAGEAKASWNEIKALERKRKSADGAREWLGDISTAQPALMRALKLQQRAAEVGFDWNEPDPIHAKIDEELAEFRAAQLSGDADQVEAEFGDLLFSLVNLARHLRIDPEAALRRTNDKFRRRFGHVERSLSAAGSSLEAASLPEMESLWQEAKTVGP